LSIPLTVRDCREAKRFLNEHAIPYTEINIETTPGAADQVIANTGKRGIPSLSSMESGSTLQTWTSFLHDEMAEL